MNKVTRGVRAIPAGSLTQWAVSCLLAAGMVPADANLVAGCLVQTSLWGIDSHGVARLPHYLRRIQAGSIEAKPQISSVRTGPCSAQLDGGHGHGMVVCHRAMDEAIAMARENGLGAVGVGNSSHCGAVGLYGRQAASQGFIGVALTHSDAFVAPYGGRAKFLGTNPICLAIPSTNPKEPICLDMATSAVSWNRVENARRENQPLEEGWALDKSGSPTTDAQDVACLLPLAAHRGYAMAFLIDLFCGPLNAMPYGPHIPVMYGDYEKRRMLGSFMMALDPKRFAGGAMLAAVADKMAAEARRQPPALEGAEVLVPGDPEYRCEKSRRRSGIPIEPGQWQEMCEWSQRMEVILPAAENDGKPEMMML